MIQNLLLAKYYFLKLKASKLTGIPPPQWAVGSLISKNNDFALTV